MKLNDLALNTLFLHFPHSGTGRYLRRLLDGLTSATAPRRIGSAAFPPKIDAARETVSLRSPFDRRRQLAKIWFEQVGFPFAARGVAVAHYPYFAAPLRPLTPTVVTVHDLVPLLRAEYRRTAAQRLYTRLVALGLRGASRIITDSTASANDLVRYLAIPRERIRVIPLAPDPGFRPITSAAEDRWAQDLRAELGLAGRFFLYLGGLDRRKNVDRLVHAFAWLKQSRGLPHQLALVGVPRPADPLFYDPRPDLERLGITDSVRLLGEIDDAAFRALCTQTEAFVFPSLYEGFGLPPLEAMACGAPVISSNASSLPEVLGDAAVLVDPSSLDALVEALARVAADPDLQADLRRRGLAQARRFSWAATVAATRVVYDEMAVAKA